MALSPAVLLARLQRSVCAISLVCDNTRLVPKMTPLQLGRVRYRSPLLIKLSSVFNFTVVFVT